MGQEKQTDGKFTDLAHAGREEESRRVELKSDGSEHVKAAPDSAEGVAV